MKKIIIAIDGFASTGKSTLARDLARDMGYAYLDTGAMYRAVTLAFLNGNADWNDPEQVGEILPNIKISFKHNAQSGFSHTYLNGVDVEEEIRSMRVAEKVSELAMVKEVRDAMVSLQREAGLGKGIVMDGRDIGTVVFPDAELKLFVIADMEERIQRRLKELRGNGVEVSEEEVRQNLEKRDYEETTRSESPLRKAADAILIDNSRLDINEQLEVALHLANTKLAE